MKKYIFAIVALLSSTAFAASTGYDLNLELSINGKHISSSRIVALAGEKASITQRMENSKDGNFIEVVATEGEIQGKKGILMNFVVGTIDRDGKKTILARPSILSTENQKAEMTVSEENNKDSVSLSVVAQRKTLQD